MTETGSIPPFTVKIYKFQWTTNRAARARRPWARDKQLQQLRPSYNKTKFIAIYCHSTICSDAAILNERKSPPHHIERTYSSASHGCNEPFLRRVCTNFAAASERRWTHHRNPCKKSIESCACTTYARCCSSTWRWLSSWELYELLPDAGVGFF